MPSAMTPWRALAAAEPPTRSASVTRSKGRAIQTPTTLHSPRGRDRRRLRASLGTERRLQSSSPAVGSHPTESKDTAEPKVTVTFPDSPLIVPYPQSDTPEVLLCQRASTKELSVALAEYITAASSEAVAARGEFVVALSGGSLLEALVSLTEEPFLSRIDWTRWHVLWVDERFVKHTSDDSNFKQAAVKLLSRVPIPEDQILPTDDSITDLEDMALDYEALLRELVEDGVVTTTDGRAFPRLDLILLGVGPEGHTASLFPNSRALAETGRWVVPVEAAPKPPPARISMTMPVINSARRVALVAAGGGKAEVVQRVMERPALPGSLPAQLVRPYGGSLTWFVDDAAATALTLPQWTLAKH